MAYCFILIHNFYHFVSNLQIPNCISAYAFSCNVNSTKSVYISNKFLKLIKYILKKHHFCIGVVVVKSENQTKIKPIAFF